MPASSSSRRNLAVWLSWTDFLEYHSGQLAEAIEDRYRATLTYPPLDWGDFDVLLVIPGPNQRPDCAREKVLAIAWEPQEVGRAIACGRLVVCSEPTAQDATYKHLPFTKLRWGINQEHFSPVPPPGKGIVGWAGRYKNPRKRFGELEAAMEGLDFRPNKSEMHLGRQVGPYDLPGIAEYYRGIDVLVCGSGYEGFGFPFLEAAACGRAIVSFDVGIARELQRDGAGVVLVDSFEEMREAVQEVDVKKFGEASAEAVRRHWTWQAVSDGWLEVLDAVG